MICDEFVGFSSIVPQMMLLLLSILEKTAHEKMLHICRDVLHLRTTIKMQWRHNCVTSTQTWLGNRLYTPSSHDGASRKFAPMPSAIVIVLANATPLSLHDMLTVGKRRKMKLRFPLIPPSSLQPPHWKCKSRGFNSSFSLRKLMGVGCGICG